MHIYTYEVISTTVVYLAAQSFCAGVRFNRECKNTIKCSKHIARLPLRWFDQFGVKNWREKVRTLEIADILVCPGGMYGLSKE